MPTPYQVRKRRDAAEEVCWTLLIMMAFGVLEIPRDAREFLSRTYDKWADLAVETGVMDP